MHCLELLCYDSKPFFCKQKITEWNEKQNKRFSVNSKRLIYIFFKQIYIYIS